MYHPPWVLIGKCGSKEVRDELVHHQLITCSRSTSYACRGCWATGGAIRWYRSPRWCFVQRSPSPPSPKARSAPLSCMPPRMRRARRMSKCTALSRCSTPLAYPAQLSHHYGLCMGSLTASRMPSGNRYTYPHTNIAYKD
jgi:hypothetical protein